MLGRAVGAGIKLAVREVAEARIGQRWCHEGDDSAEDLAKARG